MISLGLLVSLAFVPGWTGATIPTAWAALSIILGFTLWIPARTSWAGILFLAYAVLSLWWCPYLDDGIMSLWQLLIIAGVFRLGTIIDDLRPIFKGLAIGLAISSTISIANDLGWWPGPFLHIGSAPSGLLFNPVVAGETAALVIVALVSENLWAYVPGVVPLLILSQSRGALVALIIPLVCFITDRMWYAIVFGLGLLVLFLMLAFPSDDLRLAIWHGTFNDLTFFGHGSGAFANLYINTPTGIVHPEYAHNEILDLVYTYGMGTIPLFCLTTSLLFDLQHTRLWYVYVAFLTTCLYSFPLHVPTLSFIGALVAGRLYTWWRVGWCDSDRLRPSILLWGTAR